ncbi:hypothetical protein RRG08_012506 [Elysia crispata]|uniref:Uncharacterized protein n=1 Tax=Elysia crispata TaxID=231223 RepID=A0AAE1APF0_9GAST|nr:hypothetical protein RRG08_012506 [Elysia crispata]
MSRRRESCSVTPSLLTVTQLSSLSYSMRTTGKPRRRVIKHDQRIEQNFPDMIRNYELTKNRRGKNSATGFQITCKLVPLRALFYPRKTETVSQTRQGASQLLTTKCNYLFLRPGEVSVNSADS